MNVRAKTISVMGLRTRVLESGDATRGVPVVMIHGVGGWAENWREVMEPIARSGRRAIAVDLPGFGESEPPGRASYFGPRDPFYPRFVVALLDALDIRSAHLVGSSMGGSVAYMTAVTAPKRVRSLALAASGGLGTDVALFLRIATLPGSITLARLLGDKHQSREVLRSCFFEASRIPEALYQESERFGFRSYPEFVRALRGGVTIFGVKRRLRDHWVAQAARYSGPVLVVWGREDAVLPISHLADAKAVFPQAEVRIIERCGHLPMIERTDEFLGAFLPFVDGAEAAAAA
jgi:pimeloyl-ACP methyl ester carboxylesterase